MLLVYHFDKPPFTDSAFDNEEMRLQLGFFPKENTHLIFKMASCSTFNEMNTAHLEFPDLRKEALEQHIGDYADLWELPGLVLHGDEEGFSGIYGRGRYTRSTGNQVMDLDLGFMDTQKDYFTVIVNGRRAKAGETKNNLNNISLIFEMRHASVAT